MDESKFWLEMAGLASEQTESIVESDEAAKKALIDKETKVTERDHRIWLEFAGLSHGGIIPPIDISTMGKDQEMDPIPLGATFTPEEMDELVQMKLKLHALGDKAAAADANGKPEQADRIRGKIEKLTAEIDELSDMLGRPYIQDKE